MKTIVTEIPDMKTFIRGERTLEIGYPWLTFGAIMALEHILKDGRGTLKVLEMGSGGSTVFFANRTNDLLSLEHNQKWFEMVSKIVGSKVGIKLMCKEPEDLLSIIEMQTDGYFDIILADGGPNYNWREKLMKASLKKIKRFGWLVIDNYGLVNFDYTTGWDVYTFDMFRYSGHGTRLCKKL